MSITLEQSKKRYQKFVKLRKQRFTLQEIGNTHGITRERVRQILLTPPKEKKYRQRNKLDKYLTSVGQATGRDRVREMVRFRDNHTCQDCGKVRKTINIFKYNSKISVLKGRKKSLDVHHINGRCGKNSTGYDSTRDISKMVTLCHKCHYNRPEHKCKSEIFAKNVSRGKLGIYYKKVYG